MRHLGKLEARPDDSKLHFYTLPNIKEHQVPEKPEKPSKKGIVLFSLFQGFPSTKDLIYDTLSGCWARRSWMKHTDANELGVDVKFYVEEKIQDLVMPVFEQNFVEKEDIVWFSESKIEGEFYLDGQPITFASKKMESYTDERFEDYDWIFDFDCDVFVASSRGTKLSFFQTFFEHSDQDSLGCCYQFRKASPFFRTPINKRWCQGPDGKTTEASIEDWKRRFEAVAGKEMLNRYMSDDGDFIICHGGLNMFPARNFMTNRREDAEFLIKACRYLLNDELVFSLWHSVGNPVFDFRRLTKDGIPLIVMNGLSAEAIEQLLYLSDTGRPFIIHYSKDCLNLFWKKSIGLYL